ncbi:MAG: VPLPA-CTERM sorting domain-containing protein [Pseudomonadota bacterium]
MFRSLLVAGMVAGLSVSSALAATKTIDFDQFSGGTILNNTDLGGVKLKSWDADIAVVAPPTSPALANPSNVIAKAPSLRDRPFQARFLSTGIRSVSIDLGTEFTGTKLVLKALGMDNTRIGKATFKVGSGGLVGMVTLALDTDEDIKKIKFGGKHGVQDVYADNLTFTSSEIVQTPLPAGAVFLITALAGLGFVARRRRSA